MLLAPMFCFFETMTGPQEGRSTFWRGVGSRQVAAIIFDATLLQVILPKIREIQLTTAQACLYWGRIVGGGMRGINCFTLPLHLKMAGNSMFRCAKIF